MKLSLITSAVAVVAALSLAGCAGSGPAATDAATAPADAAASVTLTDGWAKAAETGMTAVFGTLENTGPEDVVVVGVQTDAAERAELHETVDDGTGSMVMRPKEGGFPIAAGDHLHLEPGGNHIMLLGLTAPLPAGDELTLTLAFDDGSSLEVTVPVKDFQGANENYRPSASGAH